MKNKYFGDVNDYRKYGLLRSLIEASQLRLGVVWMLTADDARSDGEFRRYLDEPQRWKRHDPDLYEKLRQLRDPVNPRGVRRAEEWNLLPEATYFSTELTDDLRSRDAYFGRCRTATNDCDVLFFDPDNGFEVGSVRRGSRTSSKFVYWSEVVEAFRADKSIVVYQHFPRVTRDRFVSALVAECRKRLAPALIDTYATAHVLFLVAGQRAHAETLCAAGDLVERRWSGQIARTSHVTLASPSLPVHHEERE